MLGAQIEDNVNTVVFPNLQSPSCSANVLAQIPLPIYSPLIAKIILEYVSDFLGIVASIVSSKGWLHRNKAINWLIIVPNSRRKVSIVIYSICYTNWTVYVLGLAFPQEVMHGKCCHCSGLYCLWWQQGYRTKNTPSVCNDTK